ncbi:MAG: hypothetical protein H6Q67_555 [Firmicutes bacterium]|nr:hypothetical protein [Bacillota bacterium]
MEIVIDESVKRAIPNGSLGIITAKVTIKDTNVELWEEISSSLTKLTAQYNLEELHSIPQIQELRTAYKMLGKDPARYRGSAEALLRRILQGKGLYKVNTVVDINNLVSLESLLAVGSYDAEKVEFPIEFRAGFSSEVYKGIGKGIINIANLPILADRQGPFGSPTSDSERGMITDQTSHLLMVVYSFGENKQVLEAALHRAVSLLTTFATATNIRTVVVGSFGELPKIEQ